MKSDETLFNVLRFWIAHPLYVLAGWIGGPLFRRIWHESAREALNRREALQTGLGILTAAGIDGEVATISAAEPQAFVITMPGKMSQQSAEAFRKQWKELFVDSAYSIVPVVILQGGAELSVVDQVK